MFELEIKNLGTIKESILDIKKLTIFAGENNTGKTYASYSIYGFLNNVFNFDYKFSFLEEEISNLKEDGVLKLELTKFLNENFEKIILEIEKNYVEYLDMFFSVETGYFRDTKLKFKIDLEKLKTRIIELYYKEEILIGKDKKFLNIEKMKDDNYLNVVFFNEEKIPTQIFREYFIKSLLKMIFRGLFSDVFLLPAERAGLNLFFRELGEKRNALVDQLANIEKTKEKHLNVMIMEMIQSITSKYPQPISDYIKFLHEVENLKKSKSEFLGLAKEIQKDIINGSYKIENNSIFFIPKGRNKEKLNLHMSSSTVKTFFGLVFYLEHIAKKGDCLIIDEPELSLHPDNQRKIARIIAKIVNAGINVVISTHSDYILKEFNNLIILNDEFSKREEVMKKYKYVNEELLNKENISAYIFKDNRAEKMEINKEEGIIAETFDKVINNLNESSDEIYYSKMGDEDDNI